MNIKISAKILVILILVSGLYKFIEVKSTKAHDANTEIRINAGGSSYTDSNGKVWMEDNYYNTGNAYSSNNQISQTTEDPLYQSERWDSQALPELIYSISATNGNYEITLHFAEIYSGAFATGKRVFDVSIEGDKVLDNLDIYSEVGGNTALKKTFSTSVNDSKIDITFHHEVENPKISAIEIHQITVNEPTPTPLPSITPTPTPANDFQLRINAGGNSYLDTNGKSWSADNSFNTGNSYVSSNSISQTSDDPIYQSERWDAVQLPELEYSFGVSNGEYEVILHFAEIYSGAMFVGGRVFDVSIENIKVLENYDIYADVGGYTAVSKTFTTTVSDNSLNIFFAHKVENPKISGIEIIQKESGSHLAHAVAGEDQKLVDIDADGSETVTLDGSFSHTHAFGQNLISWNWIENGINLASGEVVNIILNLGIHNITLTVEDGTGNTATDDVIVEVVEADSVSGLAAYYYDFGATNLSSIPNMTSLKPDWAKIETNINFDSTTGKFSTTPYSDHFSSVYNGLVNIAQAGTYGFAIESDDGSKLYIDGQLIIDNDGLHGMQKKSASKSLTLGQHEIKVEFFENEVGAGLNLFWTPPGQIESKIPANAFTHNYASQIPVINFLDPISGVSAGGNKVKINGFGFIFSSSQTTVNWGTTAITGNGLNIIDDKTIEITAPSGNGDISVSVTTPNGTSGPITYTYSDINLPPVKFIKGTLFTGIDGPTTLAFGPDGKLYVGTQFGDVWVLTIDDYFNVTNSFKTSIIQTSETTYRSILGIAFNPLDDPSNPKLYVSHSNLFHGQTEDIYRGKVSILSGSGLTQKQDLITGLPVSDHDHGVNGLEFGLNGELYILVGGLTNAGVPGELSSSGILDEKKFSAAALVAHIEKENFDGLLTYDAQGNQTGGFDVEVYSSGLRNPYDLVLHSKGKLYATDNGPNFGFGDKSINCNSQGSDPEENDELNLLTYGGYYGHANRFRGKTDSKQCVWRSIAETSDANYSTPLTTFLPSTNGLAEYWTNNFEGQLKGNLLAGRWGGELYKIILSDDGKTVLENEVLQSDGGLDVTVRYDGSVFLAKNQEDSIIYYKPDETAKTALYVNSVNPYRGPVGGGREVLVYGSNFNQSDVSVNIGGKNCSIVSATSSKIVCNLPSGDSTGAVSVSVTSGGQTYTLNNGFIYINGSQAVEEATGFWTSKAGLPVSLGEVSAAVVGNYIYLFAGHDSNGNGNSSLFKYDISANSWTNAAAQNVVPAVDHAAIGVINGKIFMFGGIKNDGTASNSLAIYDPVSNVWSAGKSLTKNGAAFGIGSASAGVINGKLYIAGGINNGVTIKNTFVYNPTTDSWSELLSMPEGRNHAGGVGYNGKFYVFGGRCCGGNVVDNTFDDSFVYDPDSNAWTQLNDMPSARGGIGSAVDLNGELFVIGGEGGGPSNGTFPNVESFNPITNSWKVWNDMPTPRHGIYPISLNGRLHVIAGGTSQGFSVSNVHEVFSLEEEPSNSQTIRINSGGGSYTDSLGNLWGPDVYFNTGNTFSVGNSISGTLEDALYQSERWDSNSPPELTYSIPINNGNYQIVLHFAEIYSGAFFTGGRVFDVNIEGVTVLDNLDIYSEVGANTILKKTFTINLADGTLNIGFIHQIENPKISAIEIIPL